MRHWGLLVLLAACYKNPSPSACEITCSTDDACPEGTSCRGGYCVGAGQTCQPSFTAVSAGTGFACGISTDQALYCWGSNAHHQISPTAQLTFPLATQIGTELWDSIAAGGGQVCGLRAGHLYCWGANDDMQVFESVIGDVTAPLEIPQEGGSTPWMFVSAGSEYTCAIADPGTPYCWGHGADGQLGAKDGDMDHGTPIPVKSALTDWTEVATGLAHTCGISASTGAYCWGSDQNDELGPNGAAGNESPVAVPLPGAPTSIAVTKSASCATTAAGAVYCWGINASGELGDQDVVDPTHTNLPVSKTPLLASNATGWTSVTASQYEVCGLHGGEIDCWGAATIGGMGAGVWNELKAFETVTTGATAISLGWNYDLNVAVQLDAQDLDLGCALIGSAAECWGANRFGQLATGATTMQPSPVEVIGGHVFSDIAADGDHVCGLENGNLLCWGSTVYGETTGVATGGPAPASPCSAGLDCDIGPPKSISFITDTSQLSVGAEHTCALHDNIITCWGSNDSMQLGNTAEGPRPRDVPGPGGREWVALDRPGAYAQCAQPSAGTPAIPGETTCWGNTLGGPETPSHEPTLDDNVGLAFSEYFECYLDPTSELYCEGDNSLDQFGVGAPSTGNPQTDTGRAYTAIATNTFASFMCGLRTDQQIECWGDSRQGETSDVPGLTATPKLVPGLGGCTAITTQFATACAICGGQISCWGDNEYGQLGSGTPSTDPVETPVSIGVQLAGDPWVELASGQLFTCARSQAGHVDCWGFDDHGALGNGALSANVPMMVQAASGH